MIKPPGTYKIVGKCKVCKIQAIDQQLFNQVHELRFRDDASLEVIAKILATEMLVRGIQLLPPNIQNLSNHFNNHIPVDLIAQYRLQTRERVVKQKTENQNVSDETKIAIDDLVKQKVSLQDRLEKLCDIFEKRFNDFDEANDKKINLLNVKSYTELAKELRSCLVELNKMKQGEQLVKIILDAAFRDYTLGTIQGILKELEMLKTSLKVYIRDPETVERLIENLQENLGDHLQHSSQSALSNIKDTYRIN